MVSLTLFRMDFFRPAKTYPTMMKLGTVSYTLPKEHPKNVWITWHTHWVLLTSAFFHRNSANFAISRNTDIDCISVHNFKFFKLFFESLKIVLIKMVMILIMSAKLASLGLLKNKGILKWRLWRHNFCSWRHQQNFVTWIKLCCKYGHLTKVCLL